MARFDLQARKVARRKGISVAKAREELKKGETGRARSNVQRRLRQRRKQRRRR